jgi:hypothetical protein
MCLRIQERGLVAVIDKPQLLKEELLMKNWMKLTAGLATASVLAACSGGGDSATSPSTTTTTKSLSVSGTVSGLTLASYNPFGLDLGVRTFAVNTMRCVPGSGPNVAGEGAIGVDGTFRLTITGMEEGASLGRWIFIDAVPSIPMAFASTTSFDGSTPKQQMGLCTKDKRYRCATRDRRHYCNDHSPWDF